MPAVSLVMPCYRCADTVSGMVSSVQAQTMSDWELIAVDDGSDDDTLSTLLALASQEPRMHVLHQENGGVASARNRGMERSEGQWLTFVDADDTIPPNALETMLHLTTETVDIVGGACEIVRGEERTILYCTDGDKTTMLESLVRGDSALNHMCGKLYRRSRLGQLRVQPDVSVGEDVLFNLEAIWLSREWRVSQDVNYHYLVRSDSAMEQAQRDIYARSLPMLAGIDAFIERNGLQDVLFRAHIDAYLRLLRKDRGRLRAAFGMAGPSRRITAGVKPSALTMKQRAYWAALRLAPVLSVLFP